MRKLICLAILLVFGQATLAQQEPQYSLYMFNKQVQNPAYVGAAGAIQLVAGGRTQWVGIDGHPNTFTFSGNAPVTVLRGGVGGYFVQDQIGPISTSLLKLQYAFRIPFGEAPISGSDRRMALHIGVSPGFFSKSVDGTNFRPKDYNDPQLQGLLGTKVSATSIDLGAGLYFYKPAQNDKENGEKFWVGVSMDHITGPKLTTISDEFKIYQHFNVTGGYRFDIRSVSLVPSVNFKMAGSQMQLDVNLNCHIRPMIFGLSFRRFIDNNDALIGLLGFHATQGLMVAYSYDYTLSGLNNATSGSHEIVLTYTFPRFEKYKPSNLDVKHHPHLR